MSDADTSTTDEVRHAYAKGRGYVDVAHRRRHEDRFDRWLAAHDAEVARQQAEHDAQIAERQAYGSEVQPETPWADARARAIATTIRAQFANPSTTPKETR